MNKTDKTLNRNATETLTFTIEGDYSADTIYLTAKRKVSDSTRLIDHECDSVTYSAETGLSTLTFDILPAETLGINYSLLVYDIKVENSSTDREALISGNLKVNLLPRLDSDLAPDAASNVVELDISELADDTFLYKTTVAGVPVLISKTVAEMKTSLGIAAGAFKLRLQVASDYEGAISVAKSTPVINTASFTATFVRSTIGVYSLTIPVSATYKRLVNFFFDTNIDTDYGLRWTVSASELITIYLYKDGVLSDPATDSAVYFYLDLEWY